MISEKASSPVGKRTVSSAQPNKNEGMHEHLETFSADKWTFKATEAELCSALILLGVMSDWAYLLREIQTLHLVPGKGN